MAVLSALWQHQDSVYTGQKTSWKWWAMLSLAQVVTMSPEKDQVLSTDSPKAVTTSCRHAAAHEWLKDDYRISSILLPLPRSRSFYCVL